VADNSSIYLDFKNRIIEISGSEDFVKELIDTLDEKSLMPNSYLNSEKVSERKIISDEASKDNNTPTLEFQEEIDFTQYPEGVEEIFNDTQVSPDHLVVLFDFESEIDIPLPNTEYLDNNSVRDTVRQALLLMLYFYDLLKNEKKRSSKSLGLDIEKLRLDFSEQLSNVIDDDYEQYIVPEGRSYRIKQPGRKKAKELIRKLSDAL